jgi:hypothetical protein
MRTSPALLVACLASLGVGLGVESTAMARPKAGGKATPCGMTLLPLTEGNSWTYSFTPAPQAADPKIAVIAPPYAKSFVITVKSVETKGKDTVVNLEEKVTYERTPTDPKKKALDTRVINSTISCTGNKVTVSPDSFFFAGEPGGMAGIELGKMDRKGQTWQLAGGSFATGEWADDLVVEWTHTPSKDVDVKLDAGTLELERRIQAGEAQDVNTHAGSYRAEPLQVKTTGRVKLTAPRAADGKPAEVPADWTNELWFVPGTGVVQSLNKYAHKYELVESTVK